MPAFGNPDEATPFQELPISLDAKNYKVGKVFDYLNDDKLNRGGGGDASLQMEEMYRNYGAVTSKQREVLKGHYYTISYWCKQPSDVIVRFEYRQQKTRDQIRVLEIPVKGAKGWNDAQFEIVGKAYTEQGLVNAFRARVIKNGSVVAERRSFVW